MKKKKGFTLIEIIVSIALLGIISGAMLNFSTVMFSLIRNTRKITNDVFTAQQSMESVIENVKESIQGGATPNGRSSYTLFSGKDYHRTVYGYPRVTQVSAGNNSRTLFTVIADNKMLEFAVASAAVTINFSNGSPITYAYTDTPSLNIKSNTTLTDPSNVNLTNIYRWYVSRPGFNIPMIQTPLEIEEGTKYPIFPDDYTIIPNVNSSDLTSILSSYAGRHLICTVTPASQSGKMGTSAISNPVFISGLPVISDPMVHLDASMISKEDTTVVTGDSVKTWYNISKPDKSSYATQTDSSKQPKLIEEKIGNITYNDQTYETYAKFVQFDSNDSMTINFNTNTNRTVFVVARSSGAQKFSIYMNNSSASFITINSSSTNIGCNGVDIAEILVYNSSLAQSDIDQINSYLTNKYQPVPALNTDATLTSTIGTVNNSVSAITGIPYETTLANFKSAITPASGATFEVYKTDEITVATDLASNYKVKVTAQDRTTTKTYIVTVNPLVTE